MTNVSTKGNVGIKYETDNGGTDMSIDGDNEKGENIEDVKVNGGNSSDQHERNIQREQRSRGEGRRHCQPHPHERVHIWQLLREYITEEYGKR